MEKRLINYEDLTIKDKIDHIWEYYKLHIISAICLVLFIGWMLNHYIINPPPTVGFDITFFGNYGDLDRLTELKDLLDPVIIEEEVNQETNVEFLSTDPNLDPNMLQATVTKMMGKASLKEYDIVIFEGDAYHRFSDEEVLLPIGDIVSLPSKIIELSRYVDNKVLGIDSEELFLIDVSDKEFFQSVFLSEEPIYLGVFESSQHKEKIEEGLNYLLKHLD